VFSYSYSSIFVSKKLMVEGGCFHDKFSGGIKGT